MIRAKPLTVDETFCRKETRDLLSQPGLTNCTNKALKCSPIIQLAEISIPFHGLAFA